ncbi:MAG: biotin--[acetyl-CoA-carboxylase] ligase [Desulfopila sp.]
MPSNVPSRERLQQLLAEELPGREELFPHLDCRAILRYGGYVGSVIESHDRLPRAMDHARKRIAAIETAGGSCHSGTTIVADTMSRCKGRFTRSWHAPPGGVWGCMIHANTLLEPAKRLVPLAVGVACCEAVRAVGGHGAKLRWVNDVLMAEKKVAGFLVETCWGPRFGEEYHLVGFGINVNNHDFPGELLGSATSLVHELGHRLDLSDFTTMFLAKLTWNFGLLSYEEAQFLASGRCSGPGGMHQLLASWQELSDTVGRRVLFGFDVMNDPQYEATVLGIAADGGLKLRFADGAVKVEHCGEIRYR